MTTALLLLASSALLNAGDTAPSGTDIPTYINAGHYDFVLGGDSLWQSQVSINSAAKAGLNIDGNFNTIAMRTGHISLFRDFSYNNNTVALRNAIIRPDASYSAQSDYLIGFATQNITSKLNLSGTTFRDFNRADNRGATILYAYADGATINLYGGDSANTALTFYNNRAEWDAAGAIAVSYATLNLDGHITFDSNYTGNYGGAMVVYDYDNLVNFKGTTRFVNNHASVFGGAIDVWGGQATVVFSGDTTFDGNYVSYSPWSGNDYLNPRHVNDQHARGGAINIGYISSAGSGTSVTFDGVSTFANNYVLSTGNASNNRNALGGAISVYGNNATQDYRLTFNAGATFRNNYVYAVNGSGYGGAIYYDTGGAVLDLAAGTLFESNYASTAGGAIYLQAGTINLNADGGDITFRENRHQAAFDPANKPIAGSGTPNAIYLGSGGSLNLAAAAGGTIHFHDPIASITGSAVTVRKTGEGEVIFYGDNGATTLYDSNIQANTTVEGGTFTLADGVGYGSSTFGTFTVQTGALARGGNGAALRAGTVTITGGALGAAGGLFTIESSAISLSDGSRFTGFGTLNATSDLVIAGTVAGDVADGQSLSVDARLSGSGGLRKTDEGTLILAAQNVYKGPTTVAAGTLAGGIVDAFAASSAVTVAAGGTLDLNGFDQTAVDLSGEGSLLLTGARLDARINGSQTFSGVVSGDGSLIKSGSGDFIVSGDNLYTGGTTLASGRLIATGGTSLGEGLVQTTAGTTLELRFAGEETFANRLAGNGTLEKTGPGTVTMTGSNSAIGAVTVREGTLALEQAGVFRSDSYHTEDQATTAIGSGSRLYAATTFTQAGNASTLSVAVGTGNEPAITAANAALDGRLTITGFLSGDMARASRLDNRSYVVIQTSGGISGNFDSVSIDGGGSTVDYLTLTGNVSADQLRYIIETGLSWYASPTLAHGNFTLAGADDEFNVDVVLRDRNDVSGAWTGRDLTKMGPGTLVLSAENTYTGVTDIQGGTLAAGVVNAFAASSEVRVGAGSTLALNDYDQTARNLKGAGSIELGTADLTAVYTGDEAFSGNISGSGRLVKQGAGTLVLSGDNSHSGGTTVAEGRLTAASATALGTGTAGIARDATLELALDSDAEMGNVFSGKGVLENTGTGTARLVAAGSSVGAVDVKVGTLNLEQAGAFSAGDFTVRSGATAGIGEFSRLALTGSYVQEASAELNVAIGPNNEPAISANAADLNGTLVLTGFAADMFARASRFNSQRYDVVRTTESMLKGFDNLEVGTLANPVDYLTVGGSLRDNGTVYAVEFGLTWNASLDIAHGTFTLTAPDDAFDVDVILADRNDSPARWDGHSLTKLGAGTLTLSAANTYTGSTDVQEGTLAAGAANVFSQSSQVSVAGGAELALNGYDQIAFNLTGSGSISLGGAKLTAENTASSEFSGSISGAGSIVKTGTGTLTLSGANSHSGGTTVSQGELAITRTDALGTGNVTLGNAGTLAISLDTDGTLANRIAGTGSLRKTGAGDLTLTAAGSSAGEVTVAEGGLVFGQTGTFTARSYDVSANASTSIGQNAQLIVAGSFGQAAGSTLTVAIGRANDPAIQAATASLAGGLVVTGFGQEAMTRASALPTEKFTVIKTTGGISGDFNNVTIDAVSPVDYLTLTGSVTADDLNYQVGLGLTWKADKNVAHGTFTLTDVSDAFTVDVVLADRTDSPNTWDGRSLRKEGDGTLTLSAANTYSGKTEVAGGTLAAGAQNVFAQSEAVSIEAGARLALNGYNQAANNLSGAGDIALGAAALTARYSEEETLSGTISGTGRLVKEGAETLILSGDNTLSGGVEVAEGDLRATGYGALGTGTATVRQGATLELALASDGEVDNLLAGQGTLVKSGSGVAALTAAGSAMGTVDVAAGTLGLAYRGQLTAIDFTVRDGATASIGESARLTLSGAYVQAVSGTLDVEVGNNQPAITADRAALNGALNVSGFGGGVLRQASSITANSFLVVKTATAMAKGFDNVSIGGSGSDVDYLTVGGFLRNSDTEYAIEFGLTWNADPAVAHGTFTLESADDIFEVDTVLADRNLVGAWDGNSLTKKGDGTLILSRSNTYSGATTVEGGTLAAGAANVFASSGSVQVDAGAELALNGYAQTARNLGGAGAISLGNAALTVKSLAPTTFSGEITGEGSLVKTGAADFTLSGANGYSGGTRVEEGRLIAQSGQSIGTGGVEIEQNATLVLDFAGDETVTNRLDGSGALEKTGSGIAHLTAAGSSVGAVTVKAGEVALDQNGLFTAESYDNTGTTSIASSAQLSVKQAFTQDTAGILTVTVGENNEPAITAGSADLAGTLRVSGFSGETFTTSSALGRRYVVIDAAGAITGNFDNVLIDSTINPTDYLTLSGQVVGDKYEIGLGLTWFAGQQKGNGNFTIAGTSDLFEVNEVLGNQKGPFVSGWTGDTLTKLGSGTLVLSKENTYTGATTVEEGTLRMGVDDAIALSSEVIVSEDATLDLAGNDQKLNNLGGAGNVTLNGGRLTAVNSTTSEFSGSISGAGGVVKEDSGQLTLSGANSFTGGMAINGGTLRATNGSALGAEGVTIDAPGKLELAFATDSKVANTMTGAGVLVKTESGTATLTGGSSQVGDVTVEEGTLAFRQEGVFRAESLKTETGAVTDIGERSKLEIDGEFRQESGAMLNVALGANEPAIITTNVFLSGDLTITGFDSATMGRASQIVDRDFVVIDSANPIQNDFSNVRIVNAGSQVDYLKVGGRVDGNQYLVGFQLSWTLTSDAHGTFTITGPDNTFILDKALADRGQSFGPWDGRTLTKEGAGTLVMAAQNTYTGATQIFGGTLRTDTENAFADSEEVAIAAGATLDLNGNAQTAKNLTGDGSITLGGGRLTVNSQSATEFSGDISGNGGIRKRGGASLTLSGGNSFTGGLAIDEGAVVATAAAALGRDEVAIAAGAGLELAFAGPGTDTVANRISGQGSLTKKGAGTARLTGAGSSAGAVTVEEGTLFLDQDGAFSAAGYTTESNAATIIGERASLAVTGTFTQQADSALGIMIGSSTAPSITAADATIGGSLSITGFDSALPASVLTARRHTVLQTRSGISGDFAPVDFGGQLTGVDYLVLDGKKSDDNSSYTVGFALSWYAGEAQGTGSFTMLDPNNTFEVDVLLEDQSGIFASGWNGHDLTKNGDGTLILSHANTYSGVTTVNGGTLDLRADTALGNTTALVVMDGAGVKLGATDQTVGRLTVESGALLDTGSGGLTIDSSRRDISDTEPNSIEAGTLIGGGSLTLLSSDVSVGGDNAGYTGDVTASGGSAITMASAAGLGSGGALTLAGASDSLEFTAAAAPAAGTFGKNLSGMGSVAIRANQDVAFTGNNSGYGGSIQVDADAIMRAGAAANLGTADIGVDGTLVLSSSNSWRLVNTVTGGGSFVKDGTGDLILGTSMRSFTGDSRIAAGTLVVGDSTSAGSVLGGSRLTVDAAGTLSGAGRVDGPVTNKGVIAALNSLPGFASAAASGLNIGSLGNAGFIRLAGGSVGNTLTVRDGMASQSGSLIINTILGGDDSPTDRLILDGGPVSGVTDLTVYNRGGGGAATDVGILVVDAQNGATTATDSFRLAAGSPGLRSVSGTLAAGAFDYRLLRGGVGGQADSWYLVSTGAVRPEAGAYMINREAAEGMFFHSMHDRLKGYGKFRHPESGEDVFGKTWARLEYGREWQSAGGNGLHTRTNTFALQGGMDVWTGNIDGFGVLHTGFMAGLGTSRSAIDNRGADNLSARDRSNGYAAGAYATWFMDRRRQEGLYVDTWLQHAWFRNTTSGTGLPRETYNSRLWSGSLEIGYASPVLRAPGSDWSLVPMVQAVYNDFTMGDLRESTGTVIRHRDCSRFLIRSGLRLEGRPNDESRLPAEPYFEANWLHKTRASRVALDQHTLTTDSPKNLLEIKAGLEARVLRNVRLGVGASAQFGQHGYRRLAGQLIMSVEW